MGCRLSESELQRSLDFCINLFNPTSPEEHEIVGGHLTRLGEGNELMDVTKPVVDPETLKDALKTSAPDCLSEIDGSKDSIANEDCEAKSKMVLDKINARRLVHPEYVINNLEAEELGGYVVRLDKGLLGLVKVTS
jgi:hypothetical protein